MMPLTAEVHSAVSLLESLQGSLRGCEEPRLGVQYTNDLNTLISVLHNPVLNKIIAIQDSIHDLKKELARHPSLLPSDFDISPRRGELTLHFPSDGVDEGLGGEIYPKKMSSKSPVEIVQGAPLDLIDVDQSVHNSYETHPLGDLEPPSPQRQWLKNGRGPDGDSDEDLGVNEDEEGESEDIINQSIANATLDTELRQLIRVAAEGRQIHHIQLYKPEGTSLGFSVVGLKSEQRGDLGIYVQEIQSTGIAAKDGRLRDGDQILAIDGQVLDTYISHQQAISILQKANKLVDLVVARAPAIESIAQPHLEDDEVAEEEHLKLRQESIRRQKLLVEQQQLESSLLREREQLFLQQQYTTTTHIVPPSTESRTSNMLNTEWAQVEVIHLVNDGSGLGFGIIGGRSTGVVVKTILPGGVADREGRLQSGDHILQIGEVNLRGMGSDQVASVLRQAGSHVRLVVARPVESASPDFQEWHCTSPSPVNQIGRSAPIVETRVLNDPEELDRHLNLISNGFPSSSIALSSIAGGNGGPASSSTSSASTVPAGLPTNGHSDYLNGDSELLTVNNQIASTSAAVAVVASDGHLTSAGGSYLPMEVISPCDENTVVEGGEGMSLDDLPEMENIDLDLAKDHQGLGITIAGYVCEREELSGIFVKSINAGSAADRSGHVRVNDQIVEVDGKSLTGLSNHAAVEVLRSTGQRVRLRLARYLRGPKFEQLQQAIANSELKTTPSTPNPPRAPHGEVPSSEALRTALGELEAEDQNRSNESLVEAYNPTVGPAVPLHPAVTQQASIISIKDSYDESCSRIITTSSDVLQDSSRPPNEVRLDDIELLIDSDFSGELSPPVESAIIRKWSRIVGPDMEIVVAQLKKFERGGGLGISLEGTVDVEDGREVRPHHYIRSILPDGPVGRDNRLKSGDEFLEVNNQKLLGLNHVEVVTILKELPQAVRIVCGRRVSGSGTPIHSGDAVAHREAFGARNVLGGSLQSLIPSSERLVKAKSDGSLASSNTNANSDSNSFTKVKSRSLEPLTGLAMWSTDPQHIELIKGERGLGFSILDYQDPMNPQETVIVIRSLVPGGVAEKDGRLIPGDRLVGVNGTSLEKASLDEAVAELKGAPKGPVIISVAKPISVLESPGQLDLILGDLGSSEAGSDATEDVADWHHEDDYTHEQIEERRKRRKTNDSVISTSSVPPALPVTEPPMLDRDASVLMVPVATERLIGGSSSSSASNSAGGDLFKGGGVGGRHPPHSESQTMFLSSSASPPVVAPSSGEEDISPHVSPKPHPRIHSLVHSLPRHLERVIKVRKGGDQLGINIEVVDQGINGVVVSSLVRGGAVYKDGRVRAGDLIVSVNNETMRNITNSQARAILRRTQLVSTDVCIAFIPGEEAAKHRENRLHTYKPEITEPPHERLNQRPSYASRESSEEEVLGIPSSDLTRSSTAPSFVTRQLTRSRDPSQEETLETHTTELLPSPVEAQFFEARPSSSLSDVSGAAATVVTLKNAISEVLGTEDRSRSSQKSGREDTEEEPFTITFRNVTEAGVVRGDLQPHTEEVLHAPSGISEVSTEARNNNSTTPPAMDGKHWGPERVVEVKRDENGSLGISIVGGKVDISWSGSSVTGIFVKNVLANSPAGRSGLLKTGDRILEVEGVDLRTATHEKAVEVIKKTGNPVTFIVQSLVQWNTPSTPVSRETSRLGIHAPEAVPPARTPTPELIQVSQRRPLTFETSAAVCTSMVTSSSAVFTIAAQSPQDYITTYSPQGYSTLVRAKSLHEGHSLSTGTLKRKPKGSAATSLVRSTSDGGGICKPEEEEEELPPELIDHPLTYTLYSYTDGVPTRSTTIIDHPISTAATPSSSIRHYCTLYPRKRRPKHTIASAFTLVPKAITPVLSYGKEIKSRITNNTNTTDARPILVGSQSVPETSTPVQETYPEPAQFSPESPIDEPDDSEALINPYYFYARAALAHWHSKTAVKQDSDTLSPQSKRYSLKGKSSKEKGSSQSKESSSSSSTTSIDQESVDSIGLRYVTNVASLRVGGRSSGSAGASPDDVEQESIKYSPKSPKEIFKTTPEKNIVKKPSQSFSDSSSEEIKTIMKPYEDVFEGSPIIPLSPPISVDNFVENSSFRQRLRKEEGEEALLLDSSPSHGFFAPTHAKEFFAHSSPSPLFSDEEEVGGVIRPVLREFPERELCLLMEEDEEYVVKQPLETLMERTIEEENEPLQDEYSYDPRTDPHLWPSLWKISGEIDEKIAAKVPTQPVSPCDSPSRPPHQFSHLSS